MCVFLQFFAILLNFQLSPNECFAYSEKTQYAKVKNECVLYKSKEMKNSLDDVYFTVPETYFVVILETINENCFKVQYDKYFVYVESNKITLVNFVPIIKCLEGVKCTIKETSGTQIWNKPGTEGNALTTIPAGTLNITYVAKTYGDIPIGGESNVWYYVNYTPLSNETNVYEGYIYSENVGSISEIIANAETDVETFKTEDVVEKNTFKISSTFKTVLIAIITIPIILLISIILYKFVKFIRKNTNKQDFENNSNYENFDINHNNFYQNNLNSNLKSQIYKFKETPYIKKKIDNLKHQNYPKFPIYDEDDDVL